MNCSGMRWSENTIWTNIQRSKLGDSSKKSEECCRKANRNDVPKKQANHQKH